ncbi:hypothetical protein CK203_038590 [Vitis vinifera]|uniref:Uncharacterized protein n=1 Tax=Vitis vinifera TaxID=29760 RepID=A0A438I406_VITVI|nr:hypothetical protein CK203_038590 [Vitis vinifera]
MNEVQNDLSQKIDNLQYSISRFANLNIMQEKENSPFQPHQNQKGIHEMEAKESGKEVDLPTCKLEHEVESETEKEKREEIKRKRKEKSTEKYDYIDEEPQRIVIKEEMKKHMHSPFPQALYGKIIQTKSQRNVKRVEKMKLGKSGVQRFKRRAPISKGVSQLRNHPLAHECHFAAQYAHFAAAEWAAKIPLLREIHPRCGNDLQASKMGCDLLFTRSLSLHFLPPKTIKSHSYQLRAPVKETMPFKENTITEAKVLIQPLKKPPQMHQLHRTLPLLDHLFIFSFLSPKQSEIEESSLESISKFRIQGVWDPAHSTRTGIIAHSPGILLRRHSTQMFHIRNFDAGWEKRAFQLPRSHISGSSDSAYPESFADICIVSRQSNSEDFSSEDERLSYSSLGVKKAGSPAGHESVETPSGHESNGVVAGNESNGAIAGNESNGAVAGDGATLQ